TETRIGRNRIGGGAAVGATAGRSVDRGSLRSARNRRSAEAHNSCQSRVFMNATPPSPSRSLRFFAAAAKGSLWLLLAAFLLLALAWGTLHGWIVPRIGTLRPVLESRASQALGVPVRIGGIS